MYALLAAAVDGKGWPWTVKLVVGLLMLAAAFYFMGGAGRGGNRRG